MISKKLAGYLLNYYTNALKELQTYIDEHLRRSIKGQNEIIPYIISALELIIKGKVFTSTSNPSKLLAFDNDPQIGLIKIFQDSYFEHECDRYLKDKPQLLEKLNCLRSYFIQKKTADIPFFQNFRETGVFDTAVPLKKY